jgi:hypothetical protein
MTRVTLEVLALVVIMASHGVAAEPFNVNGQTKVAHNLNHAEFEVGEVNGQSVLTLTGSVGRLKIGKIDGQSTVDASQLDAMELVVTDKIDGQSDLFVKGGQVAINLINGQSIVTLRLKDGGACVVKEINGQSRLFWNAPNNAAVTAETQNGQSRILRIRGIFN